MVSKNLFWQKHETRCICTVWDGQFEERRTNLKKHVMGSSLHLPNSTAGAGSVTQRKEYEEKEGESYLSELSVQA